MTDDAFAGLMAEVMATAQRFGHREHIHLTWLAVRRYGVGAAVGLVSDGIQRTARYAGAPQKYNATVSRAWVELVAHHVGQHLSRQVGQHVGQDVGHQDSQQLGRQADQEVGQHVGHQAGQLNQGDDFAAFVDACPDLLDKRFLTRFYRASTLASPTARTGWVEPDLAPFPWQHADHPA